MGKASQIQGAQGEGGAKRLSPISGSPISGSLKDARTNSRKNKRVAIGLSFVLEDKIQSIATAEGCSKSDVIRRAVDLLSDLRDLQQEGFSISGSRVVEDGTKELVRLRP